MAQPGSTEKIANLRSECKLAFYGLDGLYKREA